MHPKSLQRLLADVVRSHNDPIFFAGFKLRKRAITNYPTGGMGSCPHLVEAIPCEDPSCYNWKLLKLEECIPVDNLECGPGMQLPQVQCVNSDGKRPHGSFNVCTLYSICSRLCLQTSQLITPLMRTQGDGLVHELVFFLLKYNHYE